MLRPRKKIVKREVKEEALVTYYFKARKLLDRYSKQVQIGLIAVAVLIALGVLMTRSKKKSELEASGKLGIVQQAYYMGEYQRVIPELSGLCEKYRGTPSAGTALFFLANAYYFTGNLEQAEKSYQGYLDRYGQNQDFSASSLAGLAAISESRKQFAKAAGLYERAGRKYGDCFSAPFYLKEAGRCYVLENDKVKGKAVYEFLIKKYPDSGPAQDVEISIATL
jgi:TolA-binding protein